MRLLRTFDKEDFLSKFPEHSDAIAKIDIDHEYFQDNWEANEIRSMKLFKCPERNLKLYAKFHHNKYEKRVLTSKKSEVKNKPLKRDNEFTNDGAYESPVCLTKDFIIKNYKDIDLKVVITNIRISQEEFLELYDFLPFNIWMNLVELYDEFDENYIYKIKERIDKHDEKYSLNILYAITKDNFIDLITRFKKDKYEVLSKIVGTELFFEIVTYNKEFFEYKKIVDIKDYIIEVTRTVRIELSELYKDTTGGGFYKIEAREFLIWFINYNLYWVNYLGIKNFILNEITFENDFLKDVEKYLKYEGYTHY